MHSGTGGSERPRRGVAVLIPGIRHVAVTGSTNHDMLALARGGAAEGTWLYAVQQSAGRGRQGRAWVPPPGNLYASTIVRVHDNDPPAPTLALVAGLAVHDVMTAIAGKVRFLLRWPNDLMVDGAKIGGILLEREGDAVVIGIGINLAHHPVDLDRAATSLAAVGVLPPTAAVMVASLAETIHARVHEWRQGGVAPVLAAWQMRAHPLGTPLSANGQTGAFAGLDGGGALRLRLADGSISVIHAGEVLPLRGVADAASH